MLSSYTATHTPTARPAACSVFLYVFLPLVCFVCFNLFALLRVWFYEDTDVDYVPPCMTTNVILAIFLFFLLMFGLGNRL